MSSMHTFCCLPSVKKQKHDFTFVFIQCIIKQLLDLVFVMVSVRVIRLGVRLITPTLTFIIPNITKILSSNNSYCFVLLIHLPKADVIMILYIM